MSYFVGIVIVIALVALGPLLTILSLLNIRYMLTGVSEPWIWQNWLSVVILGGLFNIRKAK